MGRPTFQTRGNSRAPIAGRGKKTQMKVNFILFLVSFNLLANKDDAVSVFCRRLARKRLLSRKLRKLRRKITGAAVLMGLVITSKFPIFAHS